MGRSTARTTFVVASTARIVYDDDVVDEEGNVLERSVDQLRLVVSRHHDRNSSTRKHERLAIASACATKKESLTEKQPRVDLSLLQTLPAENISYNDQVSPVLERRCVVCHGCYDAPCQLKLSSPEGINRGASKEKVYNGARFKTMAPTRLYIDAKSTGEWRDKGFHSVLNEGTASATQNLEQSVMYKMLRLKQLNPQSRVGMLSDRF